MSYFNHSGLLNFRISSAGVVTKGRDCLKPVFNNTMSVLCLLYIWQLKRHNDVLDNETDAIE